MKHLLLFAVLFSFAFVGQAQTTLLQENFETNGEGTRYTSNAFDMRAPGATTQYFTRENNPVQAPDGTQTFGTATQPTTIGNSGSGSPNGSFFWACEGVRGAATTIVRAPGTVTLNPVGVSAYSGLTVTVALADARGQGSPLYASNGRSTAAATDHVRVQYSYDNVTYTTIGDFSGSNPAQLENWRRVGTTTDLTSTLQDFSFPIGTPAGANLYVRVEADYAGGSKEIAFDNIRLTGTLVTVAPPVLASLETTALPYAEGAPAVQLTNSLTVTNPSGTTLSGATVQLQAAAGILSAFDALSFTPGNGIYATYSFSTQLLTLSGTASTANYQTALRSVRYMNTDAVNATPGRRTAVFTVTDGSRTSASAARNIDVTAALNGPTLLNYTENFETNGEGTRYGSNSFSQNSQAFIRATQNPLPVSTTTFANIEQSGYWYAEGTKDNTTARVGTLQLAPVNATGFLDLHFVWRLGQGGNGWETNDYVKLYYDANDGNGWQLFGSFYGTGGTAAELRRDANLDGVADATGTLITPTLQDIDFALPAALAGRPAIDFRIDIANDGDEQAAFDFIRITGVSNRPPVIAAQAFSVPENSANNTLVGTVVASDPDAGQALTYALTAGNPGGAFALNSATGQLRVANTAVLDFETTPTFALTVQVTDNGTPVLNASNTITVNLTDVNEAPSVPIDTNPAANAVAENAANGTPVGITAFSTDPEGAAVTYALTNSAGGRFAINATTGVVTVANGLLLDYETTAAHLITVQASDGALTSSQFFTIQLMDVPNAAYVSSTTEQITRGLVAGATNQAILRIPVVLNGNADEPLSATSFTFTTAGTTVPANVAAVHIYYTGTSSSFATTTLFGSVTAPGTGTVIVSGNQVLQPNTNYFWLTYNVAPTATVGNLLDGTLPSLTVNGVSRTPTVMAPAGARPVVKFSDVAGTALRFNGTATGYVDLGDSNPNLVLGARYTLELWVKPTAVSGSTMNGVLGYDPGIAGRRSPYLSISENGRVEFGFGNGTSTTTMSTVANALTAGQWNQVVSTYDGAILRLYINGLLYATITSTQTPFSTPVRYVGTLSSTATSFFKGDVDEVALWTRPLSQNEIRLRRHLVLRDNEDGLASYLQFNEASGSATDIISGALGPLTGSGIARVTSTAPVGVGISDLRTVSSNGNLTFTGTNTAIAFTGISGAFDVTVARLAGPPQGTAPSGLTRTYNQAYWIINKYGTATFTNAATTYTLDPADISSTDASNPAGTLRLLKRPSNSDGAFDAPIAAAAANAAAGTVQFNLSSFSQTVLGTVGSSPLPVELTDFAAEYRRASVGLTWHTATEKNSRHFEVERSTDGHTFEPIGTVPAAGSSLSLRTYALTDYRLPPGAAVLYYRLCQVDLDGTASYSMVRVVNVGTATEPVRLLAYPNPAHDAVRVYLTGPAPTASLVLLNALGRVVRQQPLAAAGMETRVELGGVAAGVYVLRYGQLTYRLTVE